METFFILTRGVRRRAYGLAEVLRLFGHVEILPCVTDGEIRLSQIQEFRKTSRGNSTSWWISEDTAGDWMNLACLIDATAELDPDLASFSREDFCSEATLRLVRIKGRLSGSDEIPLEGSLGRLEWKNDKRFTGYFASQASGAVFSTTRFIHFDVYADELHHRICSHNLDLANRLGAKVSKYRGTRASRWYLDDVERWTKWFGTTNPSRVIEVAAQDGINANALLDLLFVHPQSEIHCIYFPDANGSQSEGDVVSELDENAFAGNHTGQIHVYHGDPAEVLAWMITEHSYWESFDFVVIKAFHRPVSTLSACCQAWSLLKPGGIMVLDAASSRVGRQHPAGVSFELFLKTVEQESIELLRGDIACIKKRMPLAGPHLRFNDEATLT